MEVYVSAYEVTDGGNMPLVAWEQISQHRTSTNDDILWFAFLN